VAEGAVGAVGGEKVEELYAYNIEKETRATKGCTAGDAEDKFGWLSERKVGVCLG